MALTITDTPFILEPVRSNGIPFRVTSSISSNTNFRYVFEAYTVDQITGVPTFKTKINPFPRQDASGLFNIGYVLRDNVSYKLQPLIQSIAANPQSVVHYQYKVGENWDPNKTWIDTIWETGALGLTFAVPHGFQVNDVILLDKTDKSINPIYDGTASVVSVPNIYEIITNLSFGASSVLEGGSVTDVLRMSLTSSVYRAYNGKRQYQQRTDLFEDFYIATDASYEWLTSFNDGMVSGVAGTKGLYSNDYQTLSYIAATAGVVPTHAVYRFYNSASASGIIATYSMAVTAPVLPYKRLDVPTGPQNLINTPVITNYITAAINATNNAYYEVQMATWSAYPAGSPTYMTRPFRYQFNKGLDRSGLQCSPNKREYPLIEIAFLNEFGAFEYLTFNLVSKTNVKVNRKKYKKVLAYNYNIGDRGDTIYDQQLTESMELTSDWLSDEEASQVNLMVRSDEVYIIQQYDALTNLWDTFTYPVIVTIDSYTQQNKLNDTLFNFKLTLDKAYQIF